MFTGQRVKVVSDEKTEKKSHITVEKSLCVSEFTEVVIPKGLKDEEKCDKDLHTAYRSADHFWVVSTGYSQEPSFSYVISFHVVLLQLPHLR